MGLEVSTESSVSSPRAGTNGSVKAGWLCPVKKQISKQTNKHTKVNNHKFVSAFPKFYSSKYFVKSNFSGFSSCAFQRLVPMFAESISVPEIKLKNGTFYISIFHILYLWFSWLCWESICLDLKVFSQLLQGIDMPSICCVSMWFLTPPFSLSFPHTLHLYNGFPFGIFLSVFAIIESDFWKSSFNPPECWLVKATTPFNKSGS